MRQGSMRQGSMRQGPMRQGSMRHGSMRQRSTTRHSPPATRYSPFALWLLIDLSYHQQIIGPKKQEGMR
jgi:hypothetical protein